MELAERFYELFLGLERAHGEYSTQLRQEDSGKMAGGAGTKPGGPSVALWRRHLAGEIGLGVVPVRDDGTVWWGAIDIDVYKGLDHKALAAKVEQLTLPLTVCRTKSGGAHLFLFCYEPLSAELVRTTLMNWAVTLGYSGVEIFPKQTRLSGNEADTGNWLNMPYQAGERSVRYAVLKDKALTAEEFLDRVEGMRVQAAFLTEFKMPAAGQFGDEFVDGPPCLQVLGKSGFPDGSRNNGLFDVGCYLKQRFPDEWETKLEVYNTNLMIPPLPIKEVSTILRSLRKKNYFYRCKEQPIVSHCSKEICKSRKYGVGNNGDDPGLLFGDMIKIMGDPPTYIWEINGKRIELDADDLLSQQRFKKRIMTELNIMMQLVRSGAWDKIVGDALARCEKVEVPDDVKRTGMLATFLHQFLGERAQATKLDEILLGKPYTTEDRVYFRSVDVLEYFHLHRVQATMSDVAKLLRDHDARPLHDQIKGKWTRYWSILLGKIERQTTAYEVPRSEGERM